METNVIPNAQQLEHVFRIAMTNPLKIYGYGIQREIFASTRCLKKFSPLLDTHLRRVKNALTEIRVKGSEEAYLDRICKQILLWMIFLSK